MCDEQSDTHNNIHRIAAIRHAGAYKSLRVITVLLGTAGIGLSTLLLTPQQTALFITYYVISWLYNSRPYQASHRPVASIVLLGMAYGLIPFLLGNGLTGITWALLLLGISWAIVRASLSILKDYKDAPGDAKSNKRTFLLSFGNRLTVRISLVLALIGYIGCVVGVSMYTSHVLLTTSSLTLLAFWLMYQRVKLLKVTRYAEANRLFHSFLEYELLFSCLAVIWLHQ